jgi:hypothetical protein
MPSNIIAVNLVLAGHFSGETVVLGGQQFTDGVLSLQGEAQEIEGLIKYLGKNYQAYPEGSEQLKEIQKQLGEDSNGGSQDNGTVQETGEQPSSGVRQDGAESASVPDLLGGTDDGDTGGGSGSIPEGDGHEDTGLHREEENGRDNPNIVDSHQPNLKLQKVVLALDPDNDAHWSEEGLPAMAAIEQAMESTGILRAEVEASAPGHNREEAAKFSTEDL